MGGPGEALVECAEVTAPVAVDHQLAIQHRARGDLCEHGRGEIGEVRGQGFVLPGLQRDRAVEAVEGQAAPAVEFRLVGIAVAVLRVGQLRRGSCSHRRQGRPQIYR